VCSVGGTMRRFGTALLLVYLAFTGVSAACSVLEVVHYCPWDGGECCAHENDCPSDPCQLAHRQLTVDRQAGPAPQADLAAPPAVPALETDAERAPAPTPAPPAVAGARMALPLLC